MVRTQIYIPDNIHRAYKQRARRAGKTMAEAMRAALERDLSLQEEDRGGLGVLEHLKKLQFSGGPRDLSHNLDHYLYGGSKKEEDID